MLALMLVYHLLSHSMKKLADIITVVGSMLGAGLIALNINYNVLGYVFFLIANLANLYLLNISTASKSLTVVTIFFVIANIIGIMRY